MPNYNQSHIYKLCCRDTDITDIYIGSTTNFTRRKCQHKSACIRITGAKYNQKNYTFIRENGGWDNWDMVLIENVNCNTKLELHKIERKFIEELKPSLNNNIPSRTRKETNRISCSEFYAKNKELCKVKQREYHAKNKEQINEKRNIKVTCECGCIVNKSALTRHKKTEKHLRLMSNCN